MTSGGLADPGEGSRGTVALESCTMPYEYPQGNARCGGATPATSGGRMGRPPVALAGACYFLDESRTNLSRQRNWRWINWN